MKLVRQIALEFREGTSDKVYEVDLCEVGPDRYVVNFRYGRRGSKLQEGTKTDVPVALTQATKAYDKLVAEKTGKGYRAAGGAAAAPEPEIEAPKLEDVEDPRARRILEILGGRAEGWTRDVDKLAFRAGELRIREAAPYLAAMLTGATDKRAQIVCRALLRCGDPGAIPSLFHVWESYKGGARSMAAHALVTLLEGPDRDAFLARVRDGLPPAITNALDGERYKPLVADLGDQPEWADALYLLGEGERRPRFVELVRQLPIHGPTFLGLRRIHKAAEARADAEVLGVLARRFDRETATPNALLWSYKDRRMQRNSKVGYGPATRKWLRRRIWRTLRRLGEAHQGDEYCELAAGVLLAVTDDDAVPQKARQRYDWNLRRKVTLPPGYPFKSLWAFNQILHRDSAWLVAQGKHLTFNHTGTATGSSGDRREEAFPELWDGHPEQLATLLDRSRARAVHVFAARALRANPTSWNRIPISALVGWFSAPYPETAELAAQIAVTRYDPKDPDLTLVLALLTCAHAGARSTAEGWVRATPAPFLADERFLVGIVLNPIVETRRLALELLGAASLIPAHARAVVDAVLGQALRSDPADEAMTLRLRDAGAVLLAAFSRELAELPLERVAELLRHPAQGVSELGARILLGHRVRPAELPDDLLAAAMTSEHRAVRGIGIRLYGELPDAILGDRFRVLVHLVTNPHADVRAAVGPIVVRLAASPMFAKALLSVLIPILAVEGPEGMHGDVVRLLRTGVPGILPLVDPGQVYRLLRATETIVQELGGDLLRTNVDPRSMTPSQLAVLASADVLGVRRTAWMMLEHRLEELKTDPEAVLPLLDARWEDSRQFAFRFVEDKLGADALTPEVALAVCDSVRPDVQAFGRKLVARLFEHGDGPRWLLRLAQHPVPAMQAWAATWLEQHARNDPERLARLGPFLVGVLARPNTGKAAKARVLAFVEGELEHPECARVLAPLLGELVLTTATTHRERYVALLAELKARHPEIENPLRVVEPEVRGAV